MYYELYTVQPSYFGRPYPAPKFKNTSKVSKYIVCISRVFSYWDTFIYLYFLTYSVA